MGKMRLVILILSLSCILSIGNAQTKVRKFTRKIVPVNPEQTTKDPSISTASSSPENASPEYPNESSSQQNYPSGGPSAGSGSTTVNFGGSLDGPSSSSSSEEQGGGSPRHFGGLYPGSTGGGRGVVHVKRQKSKHYPSPANSYQLSSSSEEHREPRQSYPSHSGAGAGAGHQYPLHHAGQHYPQPHHGGHSHSSGVLKKEKEELKYPPINILQDERTLNHDGSINFNYQADNGLQQGESVDPDGTRRGFYSYLGADGKPITVRYTAGKNGFVAEGDHLPLQPSQNGQKEESKEVAVAKSKKVHQPSPYNQIHPEHGHVGQYHHKETPNHYHQHQHTPYQMPYHREQQHYPAPQHHQHQHHQQQHQQPAHYPQHAEMTNFGGPLHYPNHQQQHHGGHYQPHQQQHQHRPKHFQPSPYEESHHRPQEQPYDGFFANPYASPYENPGPVYPQSAGSGHHGNGHNRQPQGQYSHISSRSPMNFGFGPSSFGGGSPYSRVGRANPSQYSSAESSKSYKNLPKVPMMRETVQVFDRHRFESPPVGVGEKSPPPFPDMFTNLNPYIAQGSSNGYNGAFDLGNGGHFMMSFTPGEVKEVKYGPDGEIVDNLNSLQTQQSQLKGQKLRYNSNSSSSSRKY